MAAARRAMAAAAVVLAALSLLLVGGGASYADCYDYCFKDCMSKDKNMRDYCSYSCDKTCSPDAAAALHRAPLAGVVPVDCQFACVRESCCRLPQGGDDDMEACYGQCYNGCKATKAGGLPRPLRAGTGAVRPAPALHDDHPFHEKQDGMTALPRRQRSGTRTASAILQYRAPSSPDHRHRGMTMMPLRLRTSVVYHQMCMPAS